MQVASQFKSRWGAQCLLVILTGFANAAQLKKFNHVIYRYLQRNSEARINLSIIADQQKHVSCYIAYARATKPVASFPG